MNISLKKIIYISLLVIIGYLPIVSSAASFYIEGGKHEFVKGEKFAIIVSLDTENESINAIEGSLLYPHDLLDVVEIRDGNSAITFWIEKMHESSSGVLTFSGTTPGGFMQSKAFLYTIIFKAMRDGKGQIALDNLSVLKNDGQGTNVPVQALPFSVSISDVNASTESVLGPVEDDEMPEDFKVTLTNDPDIFNNAHILIFSTQDKISGIDHYEVREGAWGFFKNVESPYQLNDQSLTQPIFLKAVDHAGNERLVTIDAMHADQNKIKYLIFYLLGILLLVCLLYIWGKKYISK